MQVSGCFKLFIDDAMVDLIDPLFTAVADLSVSVSELNSSSKNLVTKVGSLGKTTATATMVGKMGQKVFKTKKKATDNGGK